MRSLTLMLSSLAVVGVACGRVSLNSEDTGVDAGSGSSSGSTGASTMTGKGGKTGKGGSSGQGMAGVGKAGASTVTGGASQGGAPGSGGSLAPGVDGGVGGSESSHGGMPPDGDDACASYCSAYASVCPQAGFGAPDACQADCVASLELDSAACSAGKRGAYECIASALQQAPDDCSTALTIAKRQCGGATPQIKACHASCIATSTFGGGPDGCHSIASCEGVEIDLHCLDTNGGTPCTCSIDGEKIWDIATGFDHSKAGCLDDDLFRLCAKELP